MHPHSSKELPVIIVGAGGHARVLMDVLELIGREVLFATDCDTSRHGKAIGEVEIRGDEAVLEISPDEVELVNAIGSVATMDARREVYERFRDLGYSFATLIHPSAVISSRARLADGVQVQAGAVIQPGARVGPNALINTRASVDHDCLIGAHVHIAPSVTLSGAVRIGDATHIGTSATIIQGITIGKNVTVAAGAVVIKDVQDGQRVAGVPAKPMRKETALATTHRYVGEDFGIMVSAIGRRVILARLLRQSASELGLRPRLVATDINRHGAAFHIGDDRKVVPPYSDPDCMNRLLDLCREQRIRLIVPTIDPDLPFYAANQGAFRAVGTEVMVSSPQTISIVNDKELTHQWFLAQGIPTVRQIASSALLNGADGWSFPVFIKPRGGSSSIGARTVRDRDELRACTRDGAYIAQDIAPGKEYTVDVYVDRHGKCLAAVPRLRLETRGGEVVKAMTVHSPAIEAMARRIAETLPGARGALNIQIFHDPVLDSMKAIEINARFGGGYPLAHQAGAPMTRWAIEESLGLPPSVTSGPWTDGMCMLRYDDAIFIDREEAGLEWPIPRG